MALSNWFPHPKSPSGDPGSNPNDFFSKIEYWLVRAVVFVLFVVGLGKVGWDLLQKILR
jgi:hypothetical protein